MEFVSIVEFARALKELAHSTNVSYSDNLHQLRFTRAHRTIFINNANIKIQISVTPERNEKGIYENVYEVVCIVVDTGEKFSASGLYTSIIDHVKERIICQ